MEDDGTGFFDRQEHVTPHIGTEAKPRLLTWEEVNSLQLNNLNYDLKTESKLVIERLRNLDDKKKMEIEFIDDKSNAVASLMSTVFFRYATIMTFDEFATFGSIYERAVDAGVSVEESTCLGKCKLVS